MQPQRCYILLGSNLGDKKSNILKALDEIGKLSVTSPRTSEFYLTEPFGMESDEWFLNMAVEIETEVAPLTLIERFQEIEKDLGRERASAQTQGETRVYESRTIDIDIILYGNRIIDLPELTIPHPRMHLRKFVLEPLSEIAPNEIHPVFKKTIKELLEELTDNHEVKKKHYFRTI